MIHPTDVVLLGKEETVFKNLCEVNTLNPDLLNFIKILKIYKDICTNSVKKFEQRLENKNETKEKIWSVLNEIIVDVNDIDELLNIIDKKVDTEVSGIKESIINFRSNCKCLEDLIDYIEKSFNHKLKSLESKNDKLINNLNCTLNKRYTELENSFDQLKLVKHITEDAFRKRIIELEYKFLYLLYFIGLFFFIGLSYSIVYCNVRVR
jgi:DNA anti-recombination protein RmuC